MGQVMKLIEIIKELDKYDDELTIYAKEPWSIDSLAIVELEPEGEDKPKIALEQNVEYFLEIFIANEFIDGWILTNKVKPTPEDTCRRLIEYAINDA